MFLTHIPQFQTTLVNKLLLREAGDDILDRADDKVGASFLVNGYFVVVDKHGSEYFCFAWGLAGVIIEHEIVVVGSITDVESSLGLHSLNCQA